MGGDIRGMANPTACKTKYAGMAGPAVNPAGRLLESVSNDETQINGRHPDSSGTEPGLQTRSLFESRVVSLKSAAI